VPFGEAVVTRDWLKITGDVYKPEIEHPKKPVTGLACTRNEVSIQLSHRVSCKMLQS